MKYSSHAWQTVSVIFIRFSGIFQGKPPAGEIGVAKLNQANHALLEYGLPNGPYLPFTGFARIR